MARNLASIQKIASIEPIPGADSIEVATVLGWHCVVKKGDFVPGDLCIYFEIDSLLPMVPQFSFLASRGSSTIEDGTTGYKVKTIRLRKQVSQGLAIKTSEFPQVAGMEEGADVTDILGVVQWYPNIPANMRGLVKGNFPSFITKTDETRVQNLQRVLTRYAGTKCYVTEKLDGTSVTYYLKDDHFGVCSRNLELLESEGNLYWSMARKLDIEAKLRNLGGNVAIQGEIYGQGIQDNRLGVEGNRLAVFNVFDLDKYKYLDYRDAESTALRMDLEFVPVLTDCYILHDDIDKIVQESVGKSILNPKKWREGIVIRPVKEILDLEMSKGLSNARLSFKAINPEYLIANNE